MNSEEEVKSREDFPPRKFTFRIHEEFKLYWSPLKLLQSLLRVYTWSVRISKTGSKGQSWRPGTTCGWPWQTGLNVIHKSSLLVLTAELRGFRLNLLKKLSILTIVKPIGIWSFECHERKYFEVNCSHLFKKRFFVIFYAQFLPTGIPIFE